MADDPPAQASSSVSNHNKSQTLRGKQATGSSRRHVVTIPRTLPSLWLLCHCSFLCVLPQPGRKTSLPRPQPLISMNPHLRVARMRVVLTCRKTPRRDQVANTAGSRSPVVARCYGRTRSVLNLLRLLLTDSRGGPPSVSGSHTGRIAVQHLARRVPNNGAVRAHSIVACA